jgi:uncharacterized membrane protein
MPTPLVHEVMLDVSGSGSFDADGTIGALAGYSIGQLGAYTIGGLATIPSPEPVTARVLAAGVLAERGRDRVADGSPPLANELAFRVTNTDGRFTPTNAGSPLYPNVVPGRAVRWRLTRGATTYPLGRGLLVTVEPDPSLAEQSVGFDALSQLSRLVGKTGFGSPVYGNGTLAGGLRTDVALGYVLDAAGLTDPAMRLFDAGDTVLLWFAIYPSDDLFDLAVRLWATEGPGARLYDDADGRTVFKRRGAEATETRSVVAQTTVRDVDDGASAWCDRWERGAGEKMVVNQARMTHVRRVVDTADAAVWKAGGQLVLSANEARVFELSSSQQDPIASLVTPVGGGTDYTVTAGAVASAVFSRPSGTGVKLTVTAGALGATLDGPTGATADGLTVRGRLVRAVARTPISDVGQDTAASLAQFGPKPYPLQLLGEIDYLVAQSLINGYVARGASARPALTLSMPVAPDQNATALLPREIGDRVALRNDRDAFNQEAWVEAVRWETEADGTLRATLHCDVVYDTGFARWGIGRWGVDKWGI